MIKNASSISLSESAGTLPNMESALRNWFQKISIQKKVETIVNFEIVETFTEFFFKGVMQPMNPREVNSKPTGQRDWRWHTMHSEIDLELNPDELVFHKSIKYRVKSKLNYESYGYYRYDLIEDFVE